MARAAAKRFFGSVLFLIGLVAFLGFIFLLFASAEQVSGVPGVDNIDSIGKVVGVVLAAVVLLLSIVILVRAGGRDNEEMFFIPEKDQIQLAYSADDWPEETDDAPGEGLDVQVYHLPSVGRQQNAWEKTGRRGLWSYHFPRSVEHALYANDYITIDHEGNRILLRTLIAGPRDGHKTTMKTPRKLYLEKLFKEHETAQKEEAERKLAEQAAAAGPGDGEEFMQELEGRAEEPVEEPAAPAAEVFYGYSGDNPSVDTVPSIPSDHLASLKANGVETVARLCYEDPQKLAQRLRVGSGDVAAWQATAELMRVPGVGPQYASILAALGVDGISGLKRQDPAQLLEKVNGIIAKHGGTKVSERRIAAWKTAAGEMRRTKQRVPTA